MSRKGKSIFIGSIAFVIFAMARNIIPLHNMQFFVVACAVFAGVAFISCYKMKSDADSMAARAWNILPIVFLSLWIILFYVNETNAPHPLPEEELIRRYFPFPLWITLTIVGVAICLFILGKESQGKQSKIRKKIRAIVGLLFTVGAAVQFYAPNIFRDIQGGTYHSHAYTNSIINVCWLVPYSEDMGSIYGHYAIFYMPVLKLLHKCFQVDYLSGIFIVSAIIAGISILLYLYVLDYLAKSDLIFYLGMFAIGEEYFMLMQGGVYLQVHPHRMIFPMILAALVLWEHKNRKRYNITSVCLLTLSFVWSTETGIVTMLSFAAYRWVQLVMDGEVFSVRKLLLFIRELAIYAVLPFGLSYIVINGYNLLAGGSVLKFSEFMFPLISDEGFVNYSELPLPDVTHAWIGSAILFLGAVSVVLFQVFFPDKKKSQLQPFYFFMGLTGLGLMLYYINRPVEGSLFIIMFFMLILQASILQKSQDIFLEWKENRDSLTARPNCFLLLFFRIITIVILFVMAFDGIYSMPGAWNTSAETVWKRDELMEFAEYVSVQIPPDAVSFGEGVPELMSLIDRDTHLHTTDWSSPDMPLDTMERIRYNLENEQWVFCNLYSLHYLQENYPGLTDHYVLHEVLEYNETQFGFFMKDEK